MGIKKYRKQWYMVTDTGIESPAHPTKRSANRQLATFVKAWQGQAGCTTRRHFLSRRVDLLKNGTLVMRVWLTRR